LQPRSHERTPRQPRRPSSARADDLPVADIPVTKTLDIGTTLPSGGRASCPLSAVGCNRNSVVAPWMPLGAGGVTVLVNPLIARYWVHGRGVEDARRARSRPGP